MLDVYEKLPVCHNIEDAKPRTSDVILNEEIQFSSLLLEEPIQKGLAKCGYKFLSPIQRNALPLALTGNSLIVHAKSGTGKTLVFLLTALNSYLKLKSDGLFTLILAPTREIAKQVYDVCKNVSSFIEGLKVEYFIGGVPLDIDVLKCLTCHIAIGAPGRIKHLIDLGELKVQKLRLLVLDEVDVLISNKEFAINEVVSQLPVTRQDLVCTATYTDDIGVRLKSITADLQYINMSDEEHPGNVSSMSNMLLGIKQYVLPVASDLSVMDGFRKRNKLIDVLKNFNYDQCFVFVNYISLVKSVHNFLLKHDLSAEWLSSEQTQSTRVANLNKLKLNECKILVTTDLAARGIDVHNVNLVVNLSLPTPPDVYVHRMGRAGRYGSEGSVITIVHEGEELQTFKELVCFVISEPVDLYVMPCEINAETVNSTLTAIKCDPRPDSIVIREIIAKHFAKTENLAKKNQPKKRKQRKTKPRNRPSERSIRPSIAYDTITTCSSDKEITVPKMKPPHPQNANERLSGFVNHVHHELNRFSLVEIESDAIQQLAMPKKSTRSRLNFTNYYEIPDTPERCDVIDTCAPVHKSLLQLAAISRAENSFIDVQRIPLDPHEFFTSIDYKKEMNLQNNPIQVRKMKSDILNMVHKLLEFPTPIDGLSSDSADCSAALPISSYRFSQSDSCRTSTFTSDSQEPPVKMRTTRFKTSTIIPPAPPISDSASRNRFSRPFLRPIAPTHDLLGRKYSSTYEPCCMPPPQQGFLPVLRPIPPKDFAQPVLRSAAKSSLCDRTKAMNCVRCPQCDHRFSVPLPFYSTDSLPTNMRTSLAPYVNVETERMIYENHFNFISSCVARVQSSGSNN